jgi:hypothetical protein
MTNIVGVSALMANYQVWNMIKDCTEDSQMDRLFVDIKFSGPPTDAKPISIGLVDESGKHTF